MKKKLSLLLLSSSLFLALVSCNKPANQTEPPVEPGKYDDVKQLINKIEDPSFKQEGFKIHLSEKYDMESHIDNDLEKVDYTYKYEGTGSFTIAYQDGDKGVDGIAELVSSGTGYLNSVQSQTIEYEYKELDKIENKTKEEKIKNETGYDFNLLFYNNEAKVYTHTSETNHLNNEEKEETFAGKINQSLLKDESAEAINNFMSEMIIMDGYFTAEEVEKFTIEKLINSKTLDESSFNKFVEENEVKVTEGDGQIYLEFKIDYTDELKKIFDLDSSKKIKIQGMIGFNLEKYELVYYSYDLKNYFECIINGIGEKDTEDNQSIRIDEFIIEGEAVTIGYDAINFNTTLDEYTDAQDFVSGFMIHALPFDIQDNLIEDEE